MRSRRRGADVLWLAAAALAGALVAAELLARALGLGHPLLYEKTDYGYRVAPDQTLVRFGHRVSYNAYGMRSEAITPLPATGVLRVLCIGDSITFGSTATDQAQTYPYLLERLLHAQGTGRYEVLNVSAGGWALENEEAWLARHGLFGSRAVVLQVATHDLFQERASADVVGTHRSFPERPPRFALQELVQRYLLPRLRDPGEVLYHHDRNDVARTMASLERMARLVRAQDAELFVMLVEQPAGVEPDDELTRYGKAALAARTAELELPMVLTAAAIDAAGGARLFLDGLHPNAGGNAVLAREVARAVLAWQARVQEAPAAGRMAAAR